MSVSLHEHRLGGLRWIVLDGPDRERSARWGSTYGGELAALAGAWPTLPRLRRHVSGPPGPAGARCCGTPTTADTSPAPTPEADGTSAARGETLDALGIPAEDPGPSWFLDVLTSPPPGGVRSDPGRAAAG